MYYTIYFIALYKILFGSSADQGKMILVTLSPKKFKGETGNYLIMHSYLAVQINARKRLLHVFSSVFLFASLYRGFSRLFKGRLMKINVTRNILTLTVKDPLI